MRNDLLRWVSWPRDSDWAQADRPAQLCMWSFSLGSNRPKTADCQGLRHLLPALGHRGDRNAGLHLVLGTNGAGAPFPS